MKNITAIARTICLEKIVKHLEDAGIRSMTISEVKGIGEQVQLFKPYTIHNRIEILISDEKVEEVVKVILENSSTGQPGDGIISVSSIDHMIKIRTHEVFP